MTNTQRIHRHFSPLIIVFLVAVIGVAGIIFYIAFSKTTITVTVAPAVDKYAFTYTAADLDADAITIPVDATYSYTDTSGAGQAASTAETGTAKGTVTIENHYSAAQPLVKTTRLLSTSGVLFRTDETVTVPAGGSVTVPVYADQAGATGDIAPSKFEIVALWSGLKDKIYATSSSAMTGGVVYHTVVTDDLLKAASQAASIAAKADAYAAIKQQVQTTATGLTAETINFTITNQTASPAVGAATDVITVHTIGTATGIGFDLAKLANLIQHDTDQAVDPATIQYTTTGSTLTGAVAITPTEPTLDFIDVTKLTNKTADEVDAYLGTFKPVEADSIHFSPFWLTHTPPLTRQIELKMYVASK